jgi:hypothetical protein
MSRNLRTFVYSTDLLAADEYLPLGLASIRNLCTASHLCYSNASEVYRVRLSWLESFSCFFMGSHSLFCPSEEYFPGQ